MRTKTKYLSEINNRFVRDKRKEIAQMLRSTMKFYWHEGKAYPSVTSILNPTGFSHFAKEYASRGIIVHYLIRRYLEIGQWLEWRDCDVLEKEIYIVETGRNHLRIEDANYKGFFSEYGHRFRFNKTKLEQRFFNEEYSFTGKPDAGGTYYYIDKFYDAGIDYKTMGNYGKKEIVRIFMQLAAYAYGKNTPNEIGVIIPLNGKTEKGYKEPIVCTDLRPYWDMFIKERQALLDLYGI